ncbi:MAG: hypothetical protein HOV77_34650 [Hamadaea sp.]|uniref:hypothetical protein n=1 Tax=Hamadaea sp. TaxID=2024425 RepID=UPI0017B9DAF2|nr:hypothetical protein [Hamadaea sp.]NUT24322.1 hypothetical protein [Hamadaea sp.]
MPSTAQTATLSPFAESWPEGVIARYVTVGGATVDIEEIREGWKSPHWRCHGCAGTSRGAYTGPFGDPFTLSEIREQAQAHAEKCRALPRPTA